MDDFYQDGPTLGNQYTEDTALRRYLVRKLPEEDLARMEPEFKRMGARAVGQLWDWAREAETHLPVHISHDAWGRRIDEIKTAPAWAAYTRFAAREGLVAIGYERRHGSRSRLHQFALIYLFHPSSAIFTCPLAMTDGAARCLELYGDETLKARALTRLTSRDPDLFWTSGQWMTERAGGSDVSGTATTARPGANGSFHLHGTKWFTSAATSEMALTLARIQGDPLGSRGLSLFYLEPRDADGHLDRMTIHRLKDKLGTRALPTAELTMDGTRAHLVGGPGHGVRKIASLFNITRIYNSVCAIGYMRRGLALARDYAGRRVAFGKLLSQHPLHLKTLADMEVSLRGCCLLVFHLVELLGKEETGAADKTETALLRLLTPVAKLFTGKETVRVCSEVLECFGGAGYLEDTHLPALLRNAQVLAIWEGTTNVLSLDVLRALFKEETYGPFADDLRARLTHIDMSELQNPVAKVRLQLDNLTRHYNVLAEAPRELVELGARSFAFGLARAYCGALLLEQAQWEAARFGDGLAIQAAQQWCQRPVEPLIPPVEANLHSARLLGMGQVPDAEHGHSARKIPAK